eukprot:TRINITY_DN21323_c0_g1_i2.p1 TRINITY_DN21323_c0_g1~~TRINITY_DN21323_c0_g1_i2.p1  ORF type:complete len:111 (-),score=9.10 TRINITY_DN21323_c0_g1_i2:82-414(-)
MSEYNGRAACIGSCALALPIALLGNADWVKVLPGEFAKIFCPCIYVVLLLFGHRLSGLFRTPPYVFLDKLCIHQTDEAKKTAGVLGLAGFLRSSKRLVVLWSPRYFSRLL